MEQTFVTFPQVQEMLRVQMDQVTQLLLQQQNMNQEFVKLILGNSSTRIGELTSSNQELELSLQQARMEIETLRSCNIQQAAELEALRTERLKAGDGSLSRRHEDVKSQDVLAMEGDQSSVSRLPLPGPQVMSTLLSPVVEECEVVEDGPIFSPGSGPLVPYVPAPSAQRSVFTTAGLLLLNELTSLDSLFLVAPDLMPRPAPITVVTDKMVKLVLSILENKVVASGDAPISPAAVPLVPDGPVCVPRLQSSLGSDETPTRVKPKHLVCLKVLGQGAFGKVLLAKRKDKERYYAVKVVNKQIGMFNLEADQKKEVMVERSVLLTGRQHPFLMGMHFCFQTSKSICFGMDYINGGDLSCHLEEWKCFSEPKAAFYIAEVACALGYLHSLNIAHRDVKLENMLLDADGHVVLTDFGTCKENMPPGPISGTLRGSPHYVAPEMVLEDPYSTSVDWWALGIVLFRMLYGQFPFGDDGRDADEVLTSILEDRLELKRGVSLGACSLLKGLLEKDSAKRLGGCNDLAELQEHAFFECNGINWEELVARRATPPFIPEVTGPFDLHYFDPEVTQMPVPRSLGSRSRKWGRGHISGFSYPPKPPKPRPSWRGFF